MKSISSYKTRYRAAKTLKTKKKILNGAMLNLSYAEQQKFIEWQVEYQRNH